MSIVRELLPVLVSGMTPEERKREIARMDYEALRTDVGERIKHQVELAQGVIRSLILVNGGAIVALFTLIGNHGDGIAVDPPAIKRAFAWFVAGLVLALISAFGGFLSQFFYGLTSEVQSWHKQATMLDTDPVDEPFEPIFKRGNWALGIALFCAVASLASFAVGGWAALDGVLTASMGVVAPN